MQTKLDLSSTVNAQFIGETENTMTTEVCANVGLVLLQLDRHFAENSSNPTDILPTISNTKVNGYIKALSNEVANQEESVKKAWLYIQTKLAEEPNGLDKVTTWENGAEITCNINVKTTLALVYAALTDKYAYWQEALTKHLPSTASPKDIITLRGDFETTYPQDEVDRLSTLWQCFITLGSKKVCHTGIRNDFTMTLNGVYPGIWIIENIDAFLLAFMTEHLNHQIDKFRIDPPLYRAMVLSDLSGERLGPLKKALKQSQPVLEESIINTFATHGINPKNCSKKINDYLQAIEDLTPTWEGKAGMSALASILAPRFNPDKLLLVIQNWIKSSFEFNNDSHARQVMTFNSAQEISKLITKYQGLLRAWNQEMITETQIDELNHLLKSYETKCMERAAPQIDEELSVAMLRFEKVSFAFRNDARYDWVENFFIHWALAKETDNQESLIQLYSSLHEPVIQEKYLVTDDFLEQQFPQTASEIEITPYLINRLFLHAIMVHPTQWTKLFSNYFSRVHTFVEQELVNPGQAHQALALKNDSYPKALMQQMKFLHTHFQSIQEERENPIVPFDFYLPMKHFIRNTMQLNNVMMLLSDSQKTAFINFLGHEFLKTLIKSFSKIVSVIKGLSENQIPVFMNALGHEFLITLIKNTMHLGMIIYPLTETQIPIFIDALGNEFIKTLIKSPTDLWRVIKECSENQIPVFINALGNEFLKTLIKNSNNLGEVIKLLPENQKTVLINALDHEFLKTLIESSSDLGEVISELSENQILTFIEALGHEFLETLIESPSDVDDVIEWLSDNRKAVFINALGPEFLKTLINSFDDFGKVILMLSENKRTVFINGLGNEILKSYIKTPRNLRSVIKWLSVNQKPDFIDFLGNEFLKSLIKYSNDLGDVIYELSENQITAFIDIL
ncbi:MAG: hypothetical protein H0T84_07070 [Tatlockia sp.]|nr:hypothetical protein [Tatlockia sp.]